MKVSVRVCLVSVFDVVIRKEGGELSRGVFGEVGHR